MINATKGHITNVKDWTEAFNKPLKLKEIPNSGYRIPIESGVTSTNSTIPIKEILRYTQYQEEEPYYSQ